MRDLSTVPVWLVALVLAALAPWCVRAVQSAFERRLRRRTLETIAACLDTPDAPEATRRQASARRQASDGELRA